MRRIVPAVLAVLVLVVALGAVAFARGDAGDWVCLMSWTDPEVPMPTEGYGKFELNVHSNDCYTAVGPTKLTGFLTITDTAGKEVTNPVFEFDGCFDPHGDDEPTGVEFPSLLAITSTTVAPDAEGHTDLRVTCGTGSQGCSGSVSATAGGQTLGSTSFVLQEESTSTLTIPGPLPADATEVTVHVRLRDAVGPSGPVTLPVQRP